MSLFASAVNPGSVWIENEHGVVEELTLDAARQLSEMLTAAIEAAAEAGAEQSYTRYTPRLPTVDVRLTRSKDPEFGKWVVVKAAPRPEIPWLVVLWGGNGEHDADGAEVETWDEAIALAITAAQATRGVVERWMYEPCDQGYDDGETRVPERVFDGSYPPV